MSHDHLHVPRPRPPVEPLYPPLPWWYLAIGWLLRQARRARR